MPLVPSKKAPCPWIPFPPTGESSSHKNFVSSQLENAPRPRFWTKMHHDSKDVVSCYLGWPMRWKKNERKMEEYKRNMKGVWKEVERIRKKYLIEFIH
jgi:hypothetical protein